MQPSTTMLTKNILLTKNISLMFKKYFADFWPLHFWTQAGECILVALPSPDLSAYCEGTIQDIYCL